MSGLVGVVVVTHGPAGPAMLAAVTRLLGERAGLAAVDVAAEDSRDQALARIRAAIDAVDAGVGVVVASDLHGATPANCAIELARGRAVTVIVGVNLPMVVKLASMSRTGVTPDEIARAAVETATRSIRIEEVKP